MYGIGLRARDLPHACKGELPEKIKHKISRIRPLLDDIDACISYSNCLVDYYIKRKACYEETRNVQSLRATRIDAEPCPS